MRQNYSTIFGTEKHERILASKRLRWSENISKCSNKRISKFTSLIQEGPYYICVVCNRCLYRRCVIIFKIEKYVIDVIDFYYEVINSDGKLYICLTCHKKLNKSEIPAQSVHNKLEIYDFPDDLANLNRLEKAIISRRILFKKVTIMPKGQSPKLKGSICNVPINTASVASTLSKVQIVTELL